MSLPDSVTVLHADCLAAMREMPDESVQAVITDPPYGLASHGPQQVIDALALWATLDGRDKVPSGRGFMGREWDAFVPPPAVWDECLRVLKPGGHLAVFAGSRTVDLMGLSIRLAGFEMRDGLAAWLYGSGFPKSLDVGKAIDGTLLHGGSNSRRIKAANAAREVVGPKTYVGGTRDAAAAHLGERSARNNGVMGEARAGNPEAQNVTAPATDAAREWQGWGTALKPAHEPILLARKPLAGTVAANVLAHRAGAINVDACRVAQRDDEPTQNRDRAGEASRTGRNDVTDWRRQPGPRGGAENGRWPTNVVLAHHPDCVEIGTRVVRSAVTVRRNMHGQEQSANGIYGSRARDASPDVSYGDAKGRETIPAFDCHPDCHVRALDEQAPHAGNNGQSVRPAEARIQRNVFGDYSRGQRPGGVHDKGGASRFFPTFRYTAKASRRERPEVDGRQHPTVKPLALMQWLTRLLCPPGGTILDPFAGSGSTLEAAFLEGFAAVGVEADEHSVRLISVRFDQHEPTPDLPPLTLFGEERSSALVTSSTSTNAEPATSDTRDQGAMLNAVAAERGDDAGGVE